MRYLLAGAIIVLTMAGAPALPGQSLATAARTSGGPVLGVRHVIGLEKVSSQKSGSLSVQNGAMEFNGGKEAVKLPAASIDGIFVGSETTQGGGKIGRGVKTAAIAAPYGTGKVLSLLMRTKVDILTISYHDAGGALHGAIFALPKGQATDMRAQLIAAGARAGASEPEIEGKQP